MSEETQKTKDQAVSVNEEFKIPAELQAVSGHIIPLLFPDLSVSVVNAEGNVQVTHCHRVTFRVTLSPGILKLTEDLATKVRVIDEVFGIPKVVGEVMLFLPAAGGSTQASIEWPMPADAQWGPDFNNKIAIIVDPDNQITERNKSNNTCIVTGTCVG